MYSFKKWLRLSDTLIILFILGISVVVTISEVTKVREILFDVGETFLSEGFIVGVWVSAMCLLAPVFCVALPLHLRRSWRRYKGTGVV